MDSPSSLARLEPFVMPSRPVSRAHKKYSESLVRRRVWNQREFTREGRIVSRRDASNKLVFMDVESDSAKLQVSYHVDLCPSAVYPSKIVASKQRFQSASDFDALWRTLRKGDIVGLCA